jgi:tetratricopeptide (TPR) repeat protein
MSKLVSEADRLLEKGKIPEAIEKLKAALKDDPLNQLVATKLANAFIENDEKDNAIKVFTQLANRLSEAGKSQIAIAIYKQAIDLDPKDIGLKVRFATECESVGKIGDAMGQANLAFRYYIRRKKYFDAANILPLMVRLQPKDEKLKMNWIEVLQLSQADQKLVHLLVALCGPPGIVSADFSVGGDPSTLSETLYENLKKLVAFFPSDPKVAYTVAWAAHKIGKNIDFYRYLRECLRRDPDFCLGLLLFSRVLAEKQKLNESLFVFKYMKERMPADRSVDLLTVNRLVDSFVEKNGWISFTDGMGIDEIDSETFLSSIKGLQNKNTSPQGASSSSTENIPSPEVPFMDSILVTAKTEDAKKNPNKEKVEAGGSKSVSDGLEISLDSSSGKSDELEVQFTSANATQSKAAEAPSEKELRKEALKELDLPLEESTNSILLTSLIGLDPDAKAKNTDDTAEKFEKKKIREVPEIAEVEATKHFDSSSNVSVAEEKRPETPEVKPKFTFSPFAPGSSADPSTNTNESGDGANPKITGEKTEIFSPLDLLVASNLFNKNAASVKTKIIFYPQMKDHSAAYDTSFSREAPSIVTSAFNEPITGEATIQFSPFEAVDAGSASRKPHGSSIATTMIVNEPKVDQNNAKVELDSVKAGPAVSGAPVQMPGPSPAASVSPPLKNSEDDAATQIFSVSKDQKAKEPAFTQSEAVSFAASEATKLDPLEAFAQADGEATVFVNDPKISPEKEDIGQQLESAAKALADSVMTIHEQKPIPAETVSDQMNPTMVQQIMASQGEKKDKDEDPNNILAALLNKDLPQVESTQMVNLSETSNQQDHQIPIGKPLSLGFVKIPELNAEAIVVAPTVSMAEESLPQASEQVNGDAAGIDLGDDLLDGPTRILVMPEQNEATERLFHEIKRDKKSGAQPEDKLSYMMKKAERYLAKRNYYLARKAYRHALELGADSALIQERLREIRKKEMPENMYLSESNDQGQREASHEILKRLEQEFQLDFDEELEDRTEIAADLDVQFENILRENDPKTILDFSVGLYEMALYRPAENLLNRLIFEHPEVSFDAMYLLALCKYARKDYAGAVSILRKLGSDLNRSEKDKIQIYYTLGELFEKMQRTDSSREYFGKVALIDSNYRNIKQKLEK